MLDAMESGLWCVDSDAVQLRLVSLQAHSKLDRLFDGWHVAVDGKRICGRFWQMRAARLSSFSLADVYVRGADLIATYRADPSRGIQPQAYWRALRTPRGEAVEMILSVQTSRLDSDPRMVLRTWMSAGQMWCLTVSGQLASVSCSHQRLIPGQHQPVVVYQGEFGTYVEMVHPPDFTHSTLIRRAGRLAVHWRLFVERLEKGVIRRTRLRGIFSPQPLSDEGVQLMFDEFCSEPLPLTV